MTASPLLSRPVPPALVGASALLLVPCYNYRPASVVEAVQGEGLHERALRTARRLRSAP